jgi:hypothetical protein
VDELLEPIGGVKGLIDKLGTAGETAFNLWLTPIRTIIGLVQDLIDWISKIHFPKAPDINPFNRGAAGGDGALALPAGGGTVQITVNGAVDPVATARQLRDMLRSYGILVGEVAG